jgi:putative peptide zinc metalloprotease protein
VVDAGTLGGLDGRPALARGSTLKRRGAEEGARRWVLHGGGPEARWLALAGEDAALVRLLDGRRGVAELLAEADRVAGPGGPGRMVALLPELADRGLLAGGDAEAGEASDGWWRRLARPRRWAWRGADGWLAMVDARVGARLFSPPTLGFLGAVAAVGLLVFAWLVAGRYGTPFVVASKVGLGGLVFLVGRAGGVALHELAHGLAVVHLGRRVPSAGIKLVLGIPYAYVDTSEAWLESRRRRVAVSAAGPVCDLALGGTAALACLAAPPGTLRDVLFQLAFGAYLGALLNLNPLADRDGYHILVDLLGEPALRRRAREHLVRRLRGEPSDGDARTLERYAVFQLAWMLGAATFAGVMALRYAHLLGGMVPKPLVWGGLVAVWLVLLTPAVLLVAVPLRQRRRAGGAGGAG